MRTLVVLVAFLTLGGEPAHEEKLDGHWLVTAIQTDGKTKRIERQAVRFTNGQMVHSGKEINGDHGRTRFGNGLEAAGEYEWTVTYNCKMDPARKHIDLEVTPGTSMHGIYKFDANKLVLCIQRNVMKPRPTEFKTAPDTGPWLLELMREKQ